MILDGPCLRGSISRAADIPTRGAEVIDLPRSSWGHGDYVVGVAQERGAIETTSGRQLTLESGDLFVGALGVRAATLEVVGDWRKIGDDRRLDLLNRAGVLGRCTSASVAGRRDVIGLRYVGHIAPGGSALNMQDTVPELAPRRFAVPTIMILGTSMSAGKTTAAKAIVRGLDRRGLRVAGAKLAGVGRLRDTLAMGDAGAAATFDFVDAGLPSTVVPIEWYERALEHVLTAIAHAEPDVLVAEAGASPLEVYNSGVAAQRLAEHSRMTVLCASDAYAVVGLRQAFDLRPDVVGGRATSTSAGAALVKKLVDVETVDLFDSAEVARLDEMVAVALGLSHG
ncbi:MAG: hypothetical protein OEM67_01825 [Thermoleophilia bacterium]|nr:hypothetical protein [Thermoleophilia bacterium]MDH3725541.1 hypothetical protein [Thermoleophilia bacterium]